MDDSGPKNNDADRQMIGLKDLPKELQVVGSVIGVAKVLELSRALGGGMIYVPKFDTLVRPAKYDAIRREFNGRNHRDLARKYGYSVRWIRFIVTQTA